MVDVEGVTAYLLDRGLIDVTWIIDGDLEVRCLARRNRNFEIRGPGGNGLFLKQPDIAVRAHLTPSARGCVLSRLQE